MFSKLSDQNIFSNNVLHLLAFKVIVSCDPLTNNDNKLHHYWVAVTPHTNFMVCLTLLYLPCLITARAIQVSQIICNTLTLTVIQLLDCQLSKLECLDIYFTDRESNCYPLWRERLHFWGIFYVLPSPTGTSEFIFS